MTRHPRTPGGGDPPGDRHRHGADSTVRPRTIVTVAEAEDVVAEHARAGRPGEGARAPVQVGRVRSHGGHTTRPRAILDLERQEKWAENAYEDIRAHPDTDAIVGSVHAVGRVDGSAGFSLDEIARVRRHIFFDEHPVSDYDGGIVHRRYDPSPDMAEAWLRLRAGRPLPEDIALLEHELAEAQYYDAHPGASYREAHRAANEVSNWQNRMPEPTYEDYSTPWR